jgi:class 3 adenylate cyclase
VLFTDIVSSTAQTATVGDQAWKALLESHDRIAWKAIELHRGTLVKNTGDGLLAIFDNPSDGLACAAELRRELATVGLAIRSGLHAGEIMLREDGDVTGLAVNLAARVEQAAGGGSIYVSSTVRDILLGGDWAFVDRGEHALKGIEGVWRLYELAE